MTNERIEQNDLMIANEIRANIITIDDIMIAVVIAILI